MIKPRKTQGLKDAVIPSRLRYNSMPLKNLLPENLQTDATPLNWHLRNVIPHKLHNYSIYIFQKPIVTGLKNTIPEHSETSVTMDSDLSRRLSIPWDTMETATS